MDFASLLADFGVVVSRAGGNIDAVCVRMCVRAYSSGVCRRVESRGKVTAGADMVNSSGTEGFPPLPRKVRVKIFSHGEAVGLFVKARGGVFLCVWVCEIVTTPPRDRVGRLK